jgi:hypothetical protein
MDVIYWWPVTEGMISILSRRLFHVAAPFLAPISCISLDMAILLSLLAMSSCTLFAIL